MADPSPPDPRLPISADVQTIRQLVRLMQRYDLTAIDLGEGPHKIRLRRRTTDPIPAPPAPTSTAPLAIPQPPPPAAPIAHPPPTEPRGVFIESPMVGTFYSASTPDAPPFVNVGTLVRPDTTVCVIEAMKVFTDIPAGINGTITETLVKNGQPVEFGQPLFRIEPA